MKAILKNKLSLVILLTFSFTVTSSQSLYQKEIKLFQKEMNKHYADTAKSPLQKEDLADFKGLNFYPIDESLRVEAKFVKIFNPLVVTLKTTTDRAPNYRIYGEVHFEIDGQKIKLNVYQNETISDTDEYKDHLFLPFLDLTNGKTSYGGGRYVDLKIPEGETIIIDFNKAYNPYCAYNHKYSCVVPPAENFIPKEIKAGVSYAK